MCVQAEGPLAIVDKVVTLNSTELCSFDLVCPWYGPTTKNGSETVNYQKKQCAEWSYAASYFS